MADNYRDDHKAMIDSLVLGMPGVKGSKAFGYPAYKVNGKIFAFVGGEGVILKLGERRVQEVVASRPACKVFEVTDGVYWQAWLNIDHADSEDFIGDLDLIEEAVGFVAGQ
ncbi:MAG TPA: hypothetical protein PLQ56_02010 [Aggregatilineales bacterium]|nr:hypothetical protein [Aggregatilineales bacterium]